MWYKQKGASCHLAEDKVLKEQGISEMVEAEADFLPKPPNRVLKERVINDFINNASPLRFQEHSCAACG